VKWMMETALQEKQTTQQRWIAVKFPISL
jgi:hypothetical protein